jgi:hypothetical protein
VERAGDSDPSARNISLIGTTEKRIVFSPVEIKSPDSSSTSGRTSKGETPGKGSVLASKKGKAGFGANGTEDVVGDFNTGVSKPSVPDEQNVAVGSDLSPQSKVASRRKEEATQDHTMKMAVRTQPNEKTLPKKPEATERSKWMFPCRRNGIPREAMGEDLGIDPSRVRLRRS